MRRNRVFVYGTLRSGFGNHHYVAKSAFCGPAATRHPNYVMTTNGIPFVCEAAPDDPDAARIYGEIYEVDDETLAALDRLEGHPRWYRREIRKFVLWQPTSGRAVWDAWIYLCDPDRMNRGTELAGTVEFANGDRAYDYAEERRTR